MKIYLMRHGETEWNRERRLQGQSDISLNAYGRELAVETAGALAEVSFERVFCSPLDRACETARIMAGDRKVSLVRDERLKEINFGSHEGIYFEQAKQDPEDALHNFFLAPGAYTPPEGAESFAQVLDRGKAFLAEEILPLEGKCENVLVVAHGAFNRCILNSILGIPVEEFWKISLPNCAVSILALEGGKLSVLEESRVYYGHPVNGRP